MKTSFHLKQTEFDILFVSDYYDRPLKGYGITNGRTYCEFTVDPDTFFLDEPMYCCETLNAIHLNIWRFREFMFNAMVRDAVSYPKFIAQTLFFGFYLLNGRIVRFSL